MVRDAFVRQLEFDRSNGDSTKTAFFETFDRENGIDAVFDAISKHHPVQIRDLTKDKSV
jgi:hypothetical protein